MGPTIHCSDVVGKAKNAVGIGISAPLQCSLYLNTIFLGIHIDNVWMESFFRLIHISDIFLDATFVQVDLLMGITCIIAGGFAFIAEHDLHTTVQVGQFSQTR